MKDLHELKRKFDDKENVNPSINNIDLKGTLSYTPKNLNETFSGSFPCPTKLS